MNDSGVQPHYYLVAQRCSPAMFSYPAYGERHFSNMSCGPLSVRKENFTPNRTNIGEISSMTLAFMIDFTMTTSTNHNAPGGVGYQ